MNEEENYQRQISAAILQLRLSSPFFATLALFAKIIPSQTIPTAATDGRDIFINIQFWQNLRPEERFSVLAHEVLHAALLHVPRRGDRDPLLWNIAADIVVNGIILAQEGFALPAGHIRDQRMEKWSVEEVYHHFNINEDHSKRFKFLFNDLLSSSEGVSLSNELEQHWQQALQQAVAVSETLGQGSLPAGLQRELTQISPSQLDWRAYLWRFMVQTPVDFIGFDRRFIGQGLYLDSLAGEKVRIMLAVDTSGSVGGREISLFLGEVQGILRAYPHLEVSLYYADAACYGPYELEPDGPLPKPVGGGGTDFRPFFSLVASEDTANLCIYLTDGYGTFPVDPPSLPVLWVLSPGGLNLQLIPFGEAVRLLTS